MRRSMSILMLMMSCLVVAHVIVPHHHHTDRIYLLLEESHEHHDGHEDRDHNTCHHGAATAENLICSAESAFANATPSFMPIVTLLCFLTEEMVLDTESGQDFHIYNDNIPNAPPLLSWSLRAPPSIS